MLPTRALRHPGLHGSRWGPSNKSISICNLAHVEASQHKDSTPLPPSLYPIYERPTESSKASTSPLPTASAERKLGILRTFVLASQERSRMLEVDRLTHKTQTFPGHYVVKHPWRIGCILRPTNHPLCFGRHQPSTQACTTS